LTANRRLHQIWARDSGGSKLAVDAGVTRRGLA